MKFGVLDNPVHCNHSELILGGFYRLGLIFIDGKSSYCDLFQATIFRKISPFRGVGIGHVFFGK